MPYTFQQFLDTKRAPRSVMAARVGLSQFLKFIYPDSGEEVELLSIRYIKENVTNPQHFTNLLRFVKYLDEKWTFLYTTANRYRKYHVKAEECRFERREACDIFQLKQRMLSRTYKNIRPISELTEITDPIGPTYPTEEFLVCLREDEKFWKPENIDAFIDILRIVWWIPERHLIYDPAERTLTLFTGGWSGNEGIIEALQHTLFWMLYQKRGRTVGDYTFVFPEKEGDKS
jgi:hypothetical protein